MRAEHIFIRKSPGIFFSADGLRSTYGPSAIVPTCAEDRILIFRGYMLRSVCLVSLFSIDHLDFLPEAKGVVSELVLSVRCSSSSEKFPRQ